MECGRSFAQYYIQAFPTRIFISYYNVFRMPMVHFSLNKSFFFDISRIFWTKFPNIFQEIDLFFLEDHFSEITTVYTVAVGFFCSVGIIYSNFVYL